MDDPMNLTQLLYQGRLSINPERIYDFAKESNEIENVRTKKRHQEHAKALTRFLSLLTVSISDLIEFVKVIEPTAFLRTTPSHRVWIGGHEGAPGDKVPYLLQGVLDRLAYEGSTTSAAALHKEYENVHPFLDGNGRSGRALWLWQMVNCHRYDGRYRFLQMWYYQILSESER